MKKDMSKKEMREGARKGIYLIYDLLFVVAIYTGNYIIGILSLALVITLRYKNNQKKKSNEEN